MFNLNLYDMFLHKNRIEHYSNVEFRQLSKYIKKIECHCES